MSVADLTQLCEVLGLQVTGQTYNPVSSTFKKELDLAAICKEAKTSNTNPLVFAASMVRAWQKQQQAQGNKQVTLTPDSYFQSKFGVNPSELSDAQKNSVLGMVYEVVSTMEATSAGVAAMGMEYLGHAVKDKLHNGFELPGESKAGEASMAGVAALSTWTESLFNWDSPLALGGTSQSPKQLTGN